MIRKVTQIKNVAKFLDYRCSGQVDFRRLTLVAASNGRGKSTLCAIARSLAENRPELLLERATLDPNEQLLPEVHLTVDGGECRFRDGGWSGNPPSLMIFDSTFIHQNVFTGDHVTSGHRRSLLDVILGRQGVELAARVRNGDQSLRAKDGELREAERELTVHRGAMPLDDFLALDQDPDIDQKIADAEKRVAALSRTSELKKASGLASLSIPQGVSRLSHVLQATMENVSADAESRVKDHIDKHGMQRGGQSWITTGLGLIGETGECPFCAQRLDGNDLIAAYRVCFSEAYRTHRGRIEDSSKRADAARKAIDLAASQKVMSENDTTAAYWREAGVPMELPSPGSTEDANTELSAYFDAANALLADKRATPLDIVPTSAQFRQAVGGLRRLRSRWQRYNRAVTAANQKIGEFKDGLDADVLGQARAEFAKLTAQRTRHADAVAEKCSTILQLRREREQIVASRDEAKAELDEYNDTVMPSYSRNVNARLARFGVDFRICDLRKSERGRSPNAMYQIEINRVPVALGDPDEEVGTPSFRCTLSAGERSALAFALFMAQIEAHPNKDELAVVFDDPFSSMDAFRLEQTATQIRRLTGHVKQVVVLSHSNEFLARVHDGYRDAGLECRLLQIERGVQGSSHIVPWDIVEARRSTFEKHFEKLRNFELDGEGEPLDVVLHVRQTLEFDLRRRHGLDLAEASWLGDMIGLIRGAEEDSPLRELWPSLEDLEDVNDYVKRYYHGPAQQAIEDHPPIDDGALRAHVRLVLEFVHPPQA
ncbi:MAG: AAA family ATPase [Phycisphaerales bacterium]